MSAMGLTNFLAHTVLVIEGLTLGLHMRAEHVFYCSDALKMSVTSK